MSVTGWFRRLEAGGRKTIHIRKEQSVGGAVQNAFANAPLLVRRMRDFRNGVLAIFARADQERNVDFLAVTANAEGSAGPRAPGCAAIPKIRGAWIFRAAEGSNRHRAGRPLRPRCRIQGQRR